MRRLAIDSLAGALAASGDAYASDSDPELVRDAMPFALKTIEALIVQAPDDDRLLLAATSGFTQYAKAFVETDADLLEATGYAAAERLRQRALGLYLRARDYGLRGLERAVPGVGARLRGMPEGSLRAMTARDVPLLYWTAAAWGSALGLGKDRPDLLADLPAVAALLERAHELDPSFASGAIDEALISLDARPAAMGGSAARARADFERSIARSRGRLASPYVTLATAVSVPAQDRAEFERLLHQALAVDPDLAPQQRLSNLVSQRKARALLEHADDLFMDEPTEEKPP